MLLALRHTPHWNKTGEERFLMFQSFLYQYEGVRSTDTVEEWKESVFNKGDKKTEQLLNNCEFYYFLRKPVYWNKTVTWCG